MKKIILLFLIVPLIAVSSASCSSGVSQEDYDALLAEKTDLENDIEKMNTNLDEITFKYNEGMIQRSHGSVYTALLDLLLYPLYDSEGVELRFEINDQYEWINELKYRVSLTKDQQLIDYIDQLEQGETNIIVVADYIINHTRETLTLS